MGSSASDVAFELYHNGHASLCVKIASPIRSSTKSFASAKVKKSLTYQ